MARPNGGIIGPSNTPNPFIAKGVWKLRDAFNYIKAGLWPPVLGYQVNNSLRFNSGSSDYLSRTPASTTNQKTWTYSFWIKRSNLGTIQYFLYARNDDNNRSYFRFTSSDTLGFFATSSASVKLEGSITSRVFRDVSAWYHIVLSADTTQATSTNRFRIYVNGTEQTLTFDTTPSQNSDLSMNIAHPTAIGVYADGLSGYLNGYMSEIYMIDGSQLTPSSFGQTDSATGIWTPIAYTGSFGTNGFYLKFANSAALGTDSSGNGNTFTVNNLTSVDQSTDTPTNNFATLNPLFSPSPSNVSTFTEGNLKIATNSTSQNADGLSTLGLTAGKWYGEFKLISEGSGESVCGVLNNIENVTSDGLNGTGGFCVASNGNSFNNGSSQGVGAFSDTYTTNDIISVALDLDNNKVYFAKNGSWTNGTGSWNQSSPTGFFTLTSSQTYFMGVGDKSTSQSSTWEANFGNPPFTISSGNADANGFGNFEYAVPSGYFALCTRTLAIYG
jgi:hypothetical protein